MAKKKAKKAKTAKKKSKKAAKKSTKKAAVKTKNSARLVLPVLGLILNVLFWAGLGTLINNRVRIGLWQMGTQLVGAILLLWGAAGTVITLSFQPQFILGIFLCGIAWVWALISSIDIIKEVL